MGKISRLLDEGLYSVSTLEGTGVGLWRDSLRYGCLRCGCESRIDCSVAGGCRCEYCATDSSGSTGLF